MSVEQSATVTAGYQLTGLIAPSTTVAAAITTAAATITTTTAATATVATTTTATAAATITTAAAAATIATTATTTGAIFPGSSDVDADLAPSKRFSIKQLNGFFGFRLRGHRYKRKPLRIAGLTIFDHFHRFNSSCLGEHRAQLFFGGVVGQIPYIQFGFHPGSLSRILKKGPRLFDAAVKRAISHMA